ncbi:unnamed protein product [Parascedosporium putredinis]|uniref:Uncharacterized protein n=1 Tax=Parascedosporium putredinis TaxID=1442378 RepID=A0A9P1GX95_9PEZI|nr:unnamed protein product [Parascedosporium putredinis]CAI7989475.1 unnamed protein product [Parascedosporium putredinis]
MNTMNNFIAVFFILIALAFAAPTPILNGVGIPGFDATKVLQLEQLLAELQEVSLSQSTSVVPASILGTFLAIISSAVGKVPFAGLVFGPILASLGGLLGGLGS